MNQKHNTHQKVIKSTLVLTLTSLVVKILSAVYRVPFQNLVGDEGFYVYQQIYPIYGIAVTFMLSGLPIYISKILVAENQKSEKYRIIKAFFIYSSIISLGICIGLYLGSDLIALMMGDSQLAPQIKIISFIFLFVPFLSLIRGYFQSEIEMMPTAVSQLLEQGVRVILILCASILFARGAVGLYEVGQLATMSALVGVLMALLVLSWYLFKQVRIQSIKNIFRAPFYGWSKRAKEMSIELFVLCAYSAYLILFQLIDSFSVKQSLVLSGLLPHVAKVEKGIYDRGQPLVQLGLVVAVSMTAVFLPMLSKHFSDQNHDKLYQSVQSYLKVSIAISAAAALGMAALIPFVNLTLFKDNEGSLALSLFTLSIGIVSMIYAYQTIYQSQNQMKVQVYAALLGLIAKLILTPVLTYYFGIIGTSMSTLIGLLACCLLLRFLLKTPSFQVNRNDTFKIIISLAIMSGVLLIYRESVLYYIVLVDHRFYALCYALVGVLLGGATYLFSLVKLSIFTKEEWEKIPMGYRIYKWLTF